MRLRRKAILFTFLLPLGLAFIVGCVTQTERISHYERIPKNESVWEELRREFGWREQTPAHQSLESTEPFYKRVIPGISETVSGWFSKKDEHLSDQEIAADRQRFQRKRKAALERLKQRQELD